MRRIEMLTAVALSFVGTATAAIDDRSYHLGVIGAFAEMVDLDVKPLALSAPETPDDMAALLSDAREIVARNNASSWLESDFLVTDLYPPEQTAGKQVLLIFSQASALARYHAIKVRKAGAVSSGTYAHNGTVRIELATSFGRLLGYPDATTRRLIEENSPDHAPAALPSAVSFPGQVIGPLVPIGEELLLATSNDSAWPWSFNSLATLRTGDRLELVGSSVTQRAWQAAASPWVAHVSSSADELYQCTHDTCAAASPRRANALRRRVCAPLQVRQQRPRPAQVEPLEREQRRALGEAARQPDADDDRLRVRRHRQPLHGGARRNLRPPRTLVCTPFSRRRSLRTKA
jgi:hypothetical protein